MSRSYHTTAYDMIKHILIEDILIHLASNFIRNLEQKLIQYVNKSDFEGRNTLGYLNLTIWHQIVNTLGESAPPPPKPHK